ncbi:MAG: hypothetical protein NVSMB46_04870 [Candidatus Saccharimonadales bacterium]
MKRFITITATTVAIGLATITPVFAQTTQPTTNQPPNQATPTTVTPPSQTTPTTEQQSTSSNTTNQNQTQSQSKDITTHEVSGQVLKVSNDKLTVDTPSGSKEFTIPGNIRIQRNTDSVTVKDIKPGDKVSLKVDDQNQVLAVSATSGNLINSTKYIVVIVVILLILALILWRFLKKRNAGFIKTTPTQV